MVKISQAYYGPFQKRGGKIWIWPNYKYKSTILNIWVIKKIIVNASWADILRWIQQINRAEKSSGSDLQIPQQ